MTAGRWAQDVADFGADDVHFLGKTEDSSPAVDLLGREIGAIASVAVHCCSHHLHSLTQGEVVMKMIGWDGGHHWSPLKGKTSD